MADRESETTMQNQIKQELVSQHQVDAAPLARDPIEELQIRENEVAEARKEEAAVEYIAPPPRPEPPPPVSLGQALRTPAIIGGIIVLAFFGGFGGWATTAPLAGATIASGTVTPDTQRKIIQHLEGGIVREIHVREGSQVKAGDVLVTLLDTKARSTVEQDAVQHHLLRARLARFEAELALLKPEITADAALAAAGSDGDADPPGLVFPADLEEAAKVNPGVADILEGERQQFHARMEAYGLSLQILDQTIAKSRADIVQLERQIEAIKGQQKILDETVEVYSGLFDQGLESRSKLLSYQSQRAALNDDVVSLEVRITADKESIRSSELEKKNTRATRVQELVTELASIRSDLQSLQEKMRQNLDTLERTTIRSPVDGVVVNLKVHTIGGVVSPGGTVMEIVPENDVLIVDARIDPDDIENVRAGQEVKVQLTALPQREMPFLKGTLRSVSADTLTDANNETYYLGKVEVRDEEIAAARPGLTLMPGMQVQLFIMTQERTFLDYLLDPLYRSMSRSFVES
jgi:HlyD family type I secretion membrane fusion protein